MLEQQTTVTPLSQNNSSRAWKRTMRWIRRIHLYAGMLMFPWVLLYGITATLFNHPGLLSDMTRVNIAIADDRLSALPAPAVFAERLVAQLSSHAAIQQIGLPQVAHYKGSVSLRQGSPERDRFITVDMESRTASVLTRPKESEPPPAPFAQEDWFPAGKPIDEIRQGVAAELSAHGLGDGEISVRRAPKLRFVAPVNGSDWHFEYALDKGTLAARQSPEPEMSLRSFSLRLHMSHGFPSNVGPRWLWALIVDGMFLTMVFWGVSGLLMAVQMKRLRKKSLAVLAVGVLIAIYFAVAMHAQIT